MIPRSAGPAARSARSARQNIPVGDEHQVRHPVDGGGSIVHLDFEAVDDTSFRDQLAGARTFGFIQEVEALRAAGLARGGSMENVVVIDADRVLNPEGLRWSDEFVRHKALDAVGDLSLLGAPLLGRFEGR